MLIYITTKKGISNSVIALKYEVKILCSDHQVCPHVISVLEKMKFKRIQDIRGSSTSYDIDARYNFKDEQDRQKTIQEVFKRCDGKVYQIRTAPKRFEIP